MDKDILLSAIKMFGRVVRQTYCTRLLHEIRLYCSNIKVDFSEYRADGVRAEITDKYDGQEYEIYIRPLNLSKDRRQKGAK